MEDMAPALLEQVRRDYQNNLMKNRSVASVAKKLEAGTATYIDAEDYAYHSGRSLSEALKKNITADILPNGHVPQNVAEKILIPSLRDNHNLVSGMTEQVQTSLNQQAGIGLRAQTVDFDVEMAEGLVHKLTNGAFEDTKWVLGSPIVSNSQAVVDRTLKKNVEFQAKTGLRPRITREAEQNCCLWCENLEGTYEYGDEPDDIYRRHANCRCSVDFKPGDGKRQNVWSKEWHGDVESDSLHERKNVGLEQEYRPLNRGEETLADSKFKDVKMRVLESYDNPIYVSENVRIKARAVHNLDADMTKAIKAYGGESYNRPSIVIISEQEIGNGRVALYEAANNTLYVTPRVGNRIDILALQEDMACGTNPKATMYHEMWHWMQAEKYKEFVGERDYEITWENKAEYLDYCNREAKRKLDNIGINGYNVSQISEYAARKYAIGRFDETEAELHVFQRLGGKKSG